MSLSKTRWVLAATLAAESAWLFSGMAVLALDLDLPGGPFAWPVVMAIMGISLAIVHLTPSDIRWIELAYRRRILIGVGVLYLAVASQVAMGAVGVDPLWPLRVALGETPKNYGLAVALSLVLGALLWWRGGKLASAESLSESLTFSVRLGTFVLAFAALVDIVHPADLNTFAMVIVFFASGLGGLSIHRMATNVTQSRRKGRWPSIVFGPVTAVVLVGLAFGLLRQGLLSRI